MRHRTTDARRAHAGAYRAFLVCFRLAAFPRPAFVVESAPIAKPPEVAPKRPPDAVEPKAAAAGGDPNAGAWPPPNVTAGVEPNVGVAAAVLPNAGAAEANGVAAGAAVPKAGVGVAPNPTGLESKDVVGAGPQPNVVA
eukprot:CAMPEP_0195608746 /NCGR_PEP_ID=MMETSP0815-20121206/8909_1 /TAXON_ID=97485 /ORGANISM="Prymnesium parvum, Strain Texoma1" /LENGTH=138 /DNA_ID=CAMNT_0040748627 /DNA_START=310 /DNA_END=723 /DNA_ORIENTATION=+